MSVNPTAIDRNELLELIEKAQLPAGVKAKLDINPYLIGQVLTALGTINFKSIEGNRAYAFLLVVDRSQSVEEWADPLVQCIGGTYGELKKIETTGALVGGAIAITDMVEGGEVMIPFQNIHAINTDRLVFEPSGYTPLYDTLVVALVALRILVKLAAAAGKQLTPLAYLISDGSDFGDGGPNKGSKTFTVDDARAMVETITTGRRKGRVAGVAVGVTLQDLFSQIGIPEEAVREIGSSRNDLKELFDEMSQSVSTVSQGGETGGF